MRNRTSDYGAARVCKGINLRGREAYATVPNNYNIYIRPNPNRLVFSLKNAFRLSHKNSKKGENFVEKG